MSPTTRNQVKLATVATVAAFLFATSAYAQNVHLKPPKRDPSFTDQGITLTVRGTLVH